MSKMTQNDNSHWNDSQQNENRIARANNDLNDTKQNDTLKNNRQQNDT